MINSLSSKIFKKSDKGKPLTLKQFKKFVKAMKKIGKKYGYMIDSDIEEKK